MLKNMFLMAATVLVMATSAIGCKVRTSVYRSVSGSQWHTFYTVTYCGTEDYSSTIIGAMKMVEASLSPFNDSSTISLINRNESNLTDSLVEKVFNMSVKINGLSAGMFDPTVAPLVNLWGFGYATPTEEISTQAIDSALQLVGIAECAIENGQMIKKAEGTQFNFSAITKGLGCDVVADALRSKGCTDFMVEIGGEIALSGENSRGGLWRVQIDKPDANAPEMHVPLCVIEITDCGIATSGNYRNYHVDDAGNRSWHIISPVTGMPASGYVLSATIIAPTTMEADALATASMALKSADALAMVESLGEGYAALLVVATADGDSVATTTRFPPI